MDPTATLMYSKCLTCRYAAAEKEKEEAQKVQQEQWKAPNHLSLRSAAPNWQALLVVEGDKNRLHNNSRGKAFVVRSREGKRLFVGCYSKIVNSSVQARVAVQEALIQAASLGLHELIVLVKNTQIQQG